MEQHELEYKDCKHEYLTLIEVTAKDIYAITLIDGKWEVEGSDYEVSEPWFLECNTCGEHVNMTPEMEEAIEKFEEER
jgi:hypothetical protein